MLAWLLFLATALLSFTAKPTSARHLQFHLSGFECFYEEIAENTECSLEYAPITGADPRIDVFIEDPHGTIIYKEERKDYDLHKFKAAAAGTYKMCFSNVFDFSIGENLVYFDFVRGSEGSMEFGGGEAGEKALTRLETSMLTINENLNLIERYQNYHRLREANGRLAADALGQKVLWWSVGQSIVVMSVGVAQVYVLRRFFTVRKTEL